MKSDKKKVYIIFSLYKHYGDKEIKWSASYFTKWQFLYRVACWNGIRENIVDDMEVARQAHYYAWDYQTKYYLAKKVSGGYIKVDLDEYADEIASLIAYEEKKKAKRAKRNAHRRKLNNNYKFRHDPVPGVHKHIWHRGSWYRHPGTTNAKRLAYYDDEEYIFDDKKAKALPSVYDDLYRHKDKSWKTSCKVRKQWMKHLDKHIDTVKYDKMSIEE